MAEQSILTLDQIFSAKDIEETDVFVPQWGGSVRIRTFSKRQADMMRKVATVHNRVTKQNELDNAKLEMLLFVEGVIDPPMDQDDYERLKDKSAAAIALIMKAVLDASGLSELAAAEAEKSTGSGSPATLFVSSGAGTEDDGGGVERADVSGGIHALDSALSTRTTRTGSR